ncbi:MAG: hypothetical protein AB7S86_09230 [Hydrogenophaga sp.]|uniref:hypothetical protein n=1 Tax=Hydrogenophaga sp. TaxID=1904254 RepID=UPI003D0BFDCD
MGFHQQQRGDSEGYRGIPTRPAQSLDEAMGRGAGQARRDQEILQGAASSEGYESISPRFGLYLVGVFALFAIARWSFGAATEVAVLLVIACVALLLTRKLRWLLRALTPLYVGFWIGAAFGTLSLAMNGTPLSLGNIAIHLILGSVVGLAFLIVPRLKQRTNPPADSP